MCDQWYVLTFNSKICEIKNSDARKLKERTNRTGGNVYTLDGVALEKEAKFGYGIEYLDI